VCMTDPISDMLTRVRNANLIKRDSVDVPLSKVKLSVLKILKECGFIKDFKVVAGPNSKDLIRVYLRYHGPLRQRLIRNIARVSKSSRRVYRNADEVVKIYGGIGTAIYSTSKGVLSDKECRKLRVGGELVCVVS